MKYVIIDSNAIIHRAFHALPPFTAQDGSPTGAVYGFTSILLRILKELKPDYIAAAFDTAAPTFRHAAYEKYKAQRERAPDELYEQFPKTKEVLRAFAIPVLEKEGFEADDIIGTLAKTIPKKDAKAEVIIVTGDMDALQLVNECVSVFTMRKGVTDTVLYDKKAVFDRFGFGPETLIDYKALRGDPSDNIPGVRGIGEKTATDLLKKYKTLEKIYELLEKGKLKEPPGIIEKLTASKNDAFLSKNLATIETGLDIKFSPAKTVQPDAKAMNDIAEVFERFGFKSFLARMAPEKSKQEKETNSTLPFSEHIQKNTAQTITERSTLLKFFKNKSVALFFDEDEHVLFVSDGEVTVRSTMELLSGAPNDEISPIQTCEKIIFDAKPFIKQLLAKTGTVLEKKFFDITIAGFLLSTVPKDITPERLLAAHMNEFVSGGPEMWLHHFFRLRKILEKKLKDENAWYIFSEMELPLIPILSQMENRGIKVEKEPLKKMGSILKKRLEVITKEIHTDAGEKFNINSTQKLAYILFDKLEIGKDIHKFKKTPGGKISTDEEQLEDVKLLHPVIPKVLEYRELMKLKSAYADSLPKLIQDDGRIHTLYNQTRTATGRLSSEEPNLQHIPIKTSLGKEIRRAFVADAGFTFVSFDYSQLELRIAAELAGDQKMLEAFSRDLDIHALTASEVNNVPIEKVTPEMRRAAKILNFGILYGMGMRAFARGSGFSEAQAKKFYEEYFRGFSGIRRYIDETIKSAKKNGFVQTRFGRRRYFPGITGGGFRQERETERMAINMPIQGTAADVVKLAMVEVSKTLKRSYSDSENAVRLLLQIHDELLFEIAESEEIIEKAIKDIRRAMESVWNGRVYLSVDVKSGKNWADLKLYAQK